MTTPIYTLAFFRSMFRRIHVFGVGEYHSLNGRDRGRAIAGLLGWARQASAEAGRPRLQ